MADKKISQLTGATTPLAGTEVLPIVQGGSTVKVSVDNLTAGKTVKATTFDTDVAAAKVTLTGTTLAASGTDTSININITPKGSGEVALPKVNIDGGTIDGTAIGNSSRSTGKFTTVNADDGANGQIAIEPDATANGIYSATTGFGGWRSLSIKANSTGANMTFGSSGDTTLGVGNLIIGTAAKGIDFSANTHAAGMTSELLNWYEEGTWTPALEGDGGSAGSLAYTSAGKYTRVGRQVTVRGNVTVTVAGSWTGRVFITGVPFASEGNYVGSMWATAVTLSNAFTCGSQIGSYDNSYIQFPYSTDGGGNGSLNWSTNFSTGTIIFVLTYFV